jgi:hypothetical protein
MHMKYKILIILSFSSVSLFSQAEPILKSKKGNYILPQPGDWGIGVSADPFLRFVGNMFFKDLANNPPAFEFHNINQGLNFRYFKEEKYALRAGLQFNQRYSSEQIKIKDYNPDAAPDATVNDYYINSNIGLDLTFGVEYRKGDGRLQGIYGGQGLIGFETGDRERFRYGNSMEHYASVEPTRLIKTRSTPPIFRIGAMGFIGVEYFFAPKMSLGSEFYLAAIYSNQMSYTRQDEKWNELESKSEFVNTIVEDRLNEFRFSTTNLGGRLRLMFYF